MAKKRNRSINTSFKRHSYKQKQQIEKRLMLQRPSTLRAYGEAVQLSEVSSYEIPDGLTVGKPFKTLGLGQVSSRMSGDAIGKEIDVEMLT